MEAAARSRRLRLEELKRRKEAAEASGSNGRHTNGRPRAASDDQDGAEESPAMIRFDEADIKALSAGQDSGLEDIFRSWSTAKLVRSFRVMDKRLRVDYDKLKDTIEKDVAGIEENVIKEDEVRRQEELDLHNIAPKRINWDLKRDMNKRLAKLERRDKEARLILIRQRIAATAREGSDGATNAENAAARAVGSGGLLGAPMDASESDDSDAADD